MNPNYEAMWNVIEKEVTKRRTETMESNSHIQKRKMFPAAVVFACCMIVAVPATIAGVALNWESLIGGKTITTALDNGFGQRYDLHAKSEGATMTINGVVTDGEKMKVLFSIETPEDVRQYDKIGIKQMAIKDEKSNNIQLSEELKYDPASGKMQVINGTINDLKYDQASGKLLGIYETLNELGDQKKSYTLEAEGLFFKKNKEIALKSGVKVGDVIDTGIKRYPTIQIESIRELNRQLAVRYRITDVTSDAAQGNPHFSLKTSDNRELNSPPTALPNNRPGLLMEQVFDITEKDWDKSELQFVYSEEMKVLPSKWNFKLTVDGKKASEVIYTRKLEISEEEERRLGYRLEELVITPLEIRVGTVTSTLENALENGRTNYESERLLIGDQVVEGTSAMKNYVFNGFESRLVFQSPEWYKDWSKVPMKLLFQDARVSKSDRSDNWVRLQKPSLQKQHMDMKIESFDVRYTYYLDGADLVVESSSDSPNFLAVIESRLRVNDAIVFRKNDPNDYTKYVERFKIADLNGKLELKPYIYSYKDPTNTIEIKLN
ncbi:DUF4179 domain-containing protein [Paenibacillus sp. KN14-4R]|uniref:DUF4179 domain-containing protein n=1 Tax=Paenibacillus sp. KN14-4R TaxID=3445773 RepID=UPI003F9EDFFD